MALEQAYARASQGGSLAGLKRSDDRWSWFSGDAREYELQGLTRKGEGGIKNPKGPLNAFWCDKVYGGSSGNLQFSFNKLQVISYNAQCTILTSVTFL